MKNLTNITLITIHLMLIRMQFTVDPHRIDTKRRQLLNISIITIITPANRIQVTQTFRTHFIKITQKLTLIKTIIVIILITEVIKITDRIRFTTRKIDCLCGNKRQRRKRNKIFIDILIAVKDFSFKIS